MDAKELTFSKAVAMASEIEDAAKAAKITMYGNGATDFTMPLYKVNLANAVRKCKASGETVPGKSACAFSKGTCPQCGKTGHLAKN